MIDPADVHAKLQQACETVGATVADGSGASGQWTIRLPSDAGHAASVRCVPGADTLVCALAAPLPDPGAPLADGPSLGDLAVQAVRALDVLLVAEAIEATHQLAATVTVHADGLTVQELTRALAALDRVPGAIVATAAAYQGLCAQQQQLSQLVEDLSEEQPDLDALEEQLRQIEGLTQAAGAAPEPAQLEPDEALCSKCGKPLRGGAQFCTVCGAKTA